MYCTEKELKANQKRLYTSLGACNPKLWLSLKRSLQNGNKGGPKGVWTVKKARMALKLYEAAGEKMGCATARKRPKAPVKKPKTVRTTAKTTTTKRTIATKKKKVPVRPAPKLLPVGGASSRLRAEIMKRSLKGPSRPGILRRTGRAVGNFFAAIGNADPKANPVYAGTAPSS